MGSDAIRTGDIIGGRYRVGSILSRSRGLLFEGVHADFEQRVVIRVLPAALCDPKEVQRFQREARLLTRLESEHVARLLDVGTLPSGALFYVRPYLDGIDLGTYLGSRGPLPLDEATLLILQAAEAVAESHVHSMVLRELSPSHLFLTRRVGGEPLVKVIDFGTAKLLRDPAGPGGSEMTATSMFGLSCYSSPEVARKLRSIDARTDIWSLGAIFYQMLAGRVPFDGSMAVLMLQVCREEPTPIAELREDLPPEIGQILTWSLAKEPEGRFANVHAFAHALAPFASPEGQLLIRRIGSMTTAAEQRRKSLSSRPPELPLVHGSEPPPEPAKAKTDRDSSPTLIRDVESIVREKRASRAALQSLPAEPAEPLAAAPRFGAEALAPPEDMPAPMPALPEPAAEMAEPAEDMLAPPEDMLAPIEDMPALWPAMPEPPAHLSEPSLTEPDPIEAAPGSRPSDVPIEERVLIDLSLVAPPAPAQGEEASGMGSGSGAPSSQRRAEMGISPGSWSPEMPDPPLASSAENQSASSWGSQAPAASSRSPFEAGFYQPEIAPPAMGQEPADAAQAAGGSGPHGAYPPPPPLPPVPPLPYPPPPSKALPVRPQSKEVKVARIAFASALVVLFGALGYAFLRGYGKSDPIAVATSTPTGASTSTLDAPPLDPSAAAALPASPSGKPLDPGASSAGSANEGATPEGASPDPAALPGAAAGGQRSTGASAARPSPAGGFTAAPPANGSSRGPAQPATSAGAGNSTGTAEPPSAPAPSKPVEAPPTATAATPPPQAVDSAEMGMLIAIAMGGNCAFSVNDAARGTMSSLKLQIKAGTYQVTCTPASGPAQSKSVTVPRGGAGMATFKLL